MTVVLRGGPGTCLSSDAKPANMPIGFILVETDTGRAWWSNGTGWDEILIPTIENRTDDPVAPGIGRVWLRTDL